MKRINLFSWTLVLGVLFFSNAISVAQVSPEEPKDHVVVKGSSTKGKSGAEDCIDATGSFASIEYLVTVANLEESIGTPGQFNLPVDCPPMYLQLFINGELIDIVGSINNFTDELIEIGHVHYDLANNPLYQATVTFNNIPTDEICTEISADDYVKLQDIEVRMVTFLGGEYLPYVATLNAYANDPLNPFDGCDAGTLFPTNDYKYHANSDVIIEEVSFCCNGFNDDPIDPEMPFNPMGGDPSENRSHSNDTFELMADLQVSPNPCHQSINLTYELATESTVQLSLMNLSGQSVQHWQTQQPKGPQNWTLEVMDLAPGIYLGQLQSKQGVKTFKIIKQ
ncbi:MAG: T9SS type A sorting domain-containing protein [Bacteroidota bacterium]